jgi:hypothetical protein
MGGFFVVGVLGVAPCCGVGGFVLGVVVTVGYRPTGSSKKPKPLPEAPTQAPRKHKAKGELKGNQKQKYWTIDQNFKQTKKQQTPP